MAITRRLNEITVTFDGVGNPSVVATGVITDTDEATATGAARQMQAATVINAAVALRDAVLAVAQAAGKPLTF